LTGNYQLGLEKYEWRSQQPPGRLKPHGNPKAKRWAGDKLVSGEKLLVLSEQGLGDTLQFMRYIPHLRKQGIDLTFSAQDNLHGLIKCSGIDANPLTSREANHVSEGLWIPLLSVPMLLGITPENPIETKPYIASTASFAEKWQSRLEQEKRPIIAINWQGNPQAETLALKGRSLPLELFAGIANSSDFGLVSLQKGFGSEQLQTCSFRDRFVSCQDEINETWDFQETAAIIKNCDLVITSDTATAHLAGGLGQRTWLLLQMVPDWRWGMHHENSFWYPSMRLFRQTEARNWSDVMERVAEALRAFASEHSWNDQ